MSNRHQRHNSDSALIDVRSRMLLQTLPNGTRVPLYTSTSDLLDRQLGWPRGPRARAAFVVLPVTQWYPLPPPSFTIPRRNSLPSWWTPAEFNTRLTATHLSVSALSQAMQTRRERQEANSRRLGFPFPRPPPSISINPRQTDSLYSPPHASGALARLSRPAERAVNPRAAREPRSDSAQSGRARSLQWRVITFRPGPNGTNLPQSNLRHRSLGSRTALPLDATDPPSLQGLVQATIDSHRPILSENESSQDSSGSGLWMALPQRRRVPEVVEPVVAESASTILTNGSSLRSPTFDDRPDLELAVGQGAHTAPSSLSELTAPNFNDRPAASLRTRRRYESTGEEFIWQPTSSLLLGSLDSNNADLAVQEPIDPSLFDNFDWARADPAPPSTLATSDRDQDDASQTADHVDPTATSTSSPTRQELGPGTLAELTESAASLLIGDAISQTQQGGWDRIDRSINLEHQIRGTPLVEGQSYSSAARSNDPVGIPIPQMQLVLPQMPLGAPHPQIDQILSDSSSDSSSYEDPIPELELGPPQMPLDSPQVQLGPILVLGDSTGDSSDDGDVPSSLMYEHSDSNRNSTEVSPHRQGIPGEEGSISRIDWATTVERPALPRRNAIVDFSRRRRSSAPESVPVWPPAEDATVAANSTAVRLDSVSQFVEQITADKAESDPGDYEGEVEMFEIEMDD